MKNGDGNMFEKFMQAHPRTEVLEAYIVDANGIPRGKWIPVNTAEKVFREGLRLPLSLHALDIWGEDVHGSGLISETGDNDGAAKPVPGTLLPVPWLQRPSAQVMLSMHDGQTGAPFFADPRHVLQKVLDRYAEQGLTPVVASELEFYFFDIERDENGHPQPPLMPKTGERGRTVNLYSLDELAGREDLLADIAAACNAYNIPADTTISEGGPGQYEINLLHIPDALVAADQATLFKRLIKGTARKHGLDASFMAKPFGERAGNGMHVHFSILDKNGDNVFAGDDAAGSDTLRHAVGGLLRHMADCTLVFAPHANSYRRFLKGSHAPTRIAWGYDNRTASVRIPDSERAATRIEQRVAGADSNIYLVMAVLLGAALDGILRETEPPPVSEGNVYDSDAPSLPDTWQAALTRFSESGFIADWLGADYRHVYAACKAQEMDIMNKRVSDIEYDACLRTV